MRVAVLFLLAQPCIPGGGELRRPRTSLDRLPSKPCIPGGGESRRLWMSLDLLPAQPCIPGGGELRRLWTSLGLLLNKCTKHCFICDCSSWTSLDLLPGRTGRGGD